MSTPKAPGTGNTDQARREHEAYIHESLSADEYFAGDEVAAQAAALKKRKLIVIGSSSFLLMLVVLIMFACQPPKGTIMYGLCSAFLEQIVDYPPTVQHLYVEQFPRSVRIYFNQMDAFGQFTQNTIECAADPKALPNIRFDTVLFNRKPVDPAKVERFNPSIPVIAASKPDLTLPEPPEDALKDLPD